MRLRATAACDTPLSRQGRGEKSGEMAGWEDKEGEITEASERQEQYRGSVWSEGGGSNKTHQNERQRRRRFILINFTGIGAGQGCGPSSVRSGESARQAAIKRQAETRQADRQGGWERKLD